MGKHVGKLSNQFLKLDSLIFNCFLLLLALLDKSTNAFTVHPFNHIKIDTYCYDTSILKKKQEKKAIPENFEIFRCRPKNVVSRRKLKKYKFFKGRNELYKYKI